MRWKPLVAVAFLIWEAWWAYVYFTATIPDERMDTVFALLMGVGVPIWLAAAVGGTLWMVAWIKRSVRRD
jgi:sugar lactone lactonase YvrE